MVSVTNFDPNYLGIGRTEWPEKILFYLFTNHNQKSFAARAAFGSLFLLKKQLI